MTDQAPPIALDVREAVAWIRLQRPKAMNSVNGAMLDALNEALDKIEADESIRAVVLTGAGDAFCAGADLKALQVQDGGLDPAQVAEFVSYAAHTLERLPALAQPVIAGVNGPALAGGLEFVLACDVVIASSGAYLGDAHANFGLLPGAGGSVRLARVLGTHRAKYLAFTGQFFPPSHPALAGLVSEIVEPDQLEARLEELAMDFARKSPLGLAAMKRLIDASLDLEIDDALQAEQEALREHAETLDFAEGIAAFREKRPARYPGR